MKQIGLKTVTFGVLSVVTGTILTAGCKVMITSPQKEVSVTTSDGVQGSAPTEMRVWWWSDKKATVSKSGYETVTRRITSASPSIVNVALKREFNVKTNPDGAVLAVDGDQKGNAPMTVAIDDSGSSTLQVSKKGYVPKQLAINTETPKDIFVELDQDGSGRSLLNLIPNQNGITVRKVAIFADTELGETSPNVASTKRLTAQPQNEYIQDFSLLPDGKSLVTCIVEEYEKDGKIEYRSNLWILDTSKAGAPRRAATSGNYFDITPNASVDGKTLYFSSTRNGRLSIWNLNMKSMSGLRLVTSANTADYLPALSPDASMLLYTAIIPGSANPSYLWFRPAEGGMPGQLREGYSPKWNPDGKQLLFVKGDRAKNQAKIWVMDADGGNPTQLSVGNGEFNDIDPQWSVDGTKIVFASNRGTIKGKQNYDIWMMDADGQHLTQLTTNSSCDDKPVFAPDGKTIFFRSNRGLVWDIWVMQVNENK
ncbi:MAG: PD40 domain-containing protein [Kiritimatiellae bacterium]|nr:PD40 domain-containing protein [Kiritimatiellia bacterium]